jgi:hypothetical protein
LLVLFNDVIEILDRASFNTSLVLLVYEPAIRQLISTTMPSTCSLRPRVTRSDRTLSMIIEKGLIRTFDTAGEF